MRPAPPEAPVTAPRVQMTDCAAFAGSAINVGRSCQTTHPWSWNRLRIHRIGARPCESSAGAKSGPFTAFGRSVLRPSLRSVLVDRDPPSRRQPRPRQRTTASGGRLPLGAGADAGCRADVVEGRRHKRAQAPSPLDTCVASDATLVRGCPAWLSAARAGRRGSQLRHDRPPPRPERQLHPQCLSAVSPEPQPVASFSALPDFLDCHDHPRGDRVAGFRATAIATKLGPPFGKPCRGFPLGSLAFARLLLPTGRAKRHLLPSLLGRHDLDLDFLYVDFQRHWRQSAYGL